MGCRLVFNPFHPSRPEGSIAYKNLILGGLIVICGTLCWLELGLSIPFHKINVNGEFRKVSAPRSGGEKNFVSTEAMIRQCALT
jgi:hypothetical protein